MPEGTVDMCPGHGDPPLLGKMRDKDADHRPARRRVEDLAVGGCVRNGEADGQDDLALLEHGSLCAGKEITDPDYATVGPHHRIEGERRGRVFARGIVECKRASQRSAIADLDIANACREPSERGDRDLDDVV